MCTQAGAWEEIIRPGVDGYIVPVNDQQALTEKMNMLLQDSQKLAEMGRNGRERVVSNYRVEDEARKLITLFRELQ